MLIVEDGTGLPNADSLGSVAEADAYHASRGNATWQTFSLARKEQNMRKACDYITYIFGNSFVGVRAYPNQSLPFPRYYNYNIILTPEPVKQAQFELALIADTNPLLPNQTTVRKKMVKVGPITVEYDAGGFQGPRFISATARLVPYLDTRSTGITARVVRT